MTGRSKWNHLRIQHIDLLTFDECHYAQVESNHPFAEIMKIFYKSDVAKHTCIFGMTASPIFGRGDLVERNDVIEQNVQCSDVLCGSYLSLVAASFLTQCKKEGVEKLCSDLSVEHTDARVLMLAWKMNAKKQGYFTQDEWRTGLTSLHADTLKKLKKQLSHLQKQILFNHQANAFSLYLLDSERIQGFEHGTVDELLQVSPGGNETCSKVFNLYDHGQSGHFILYR
ncbi:hypothetical protein R6Q59_004685 [Mikania micrantha]